MAFCIMCGTENVAQALFCFQCGEKMVVKEIVPGATLEGREPFELIMNKDGVGNRTTEETKPLAKPVNIEMQPFSEGKNVLYGNLWSTGLLLVWINSILGVLGIGLMMKWEQSMDVSWMVLIFSVGLAIGSVAISILYIKYISFGIFGETKGWRSLLRGLLILLGGTITMAIPGVNFVIGTIVGPKFFCEGYRQYYLSQNYHFFTRTGKFKKFAMIQYALYLIWIGLLVSYLPK